jgi:hypothetical protein
LTKGDFSARFTPVRPFPTDVEETVKKLANFAMTVAAYICLPVLFIIGSESRLRRCVSIVVGLIFSLLLFGAVRLLDGPNLCLEVILPQLWLMVICHIIGGRVAGLVGRNILITFVVYVAINLLDLINTESDVYVAMAVSGAITANIVSRPSKTGAWCGYATGAKRALATAAALAAGCWLCFIVTTTAYVVSHLNGVGAWFWMILLVMSIRALLPAACCFGGAALMAAATELYKRRTPPTTQS